MFEVLVWQQLFVDMVGNHDGGVLDFCTPIKMRPPPAYIYFILHDRVTPDSKLFQAQHSTWIE